MLPPKTNHTIMLTATVSSLLALLFLAHHGAGQDVSRPLLEVVPNTLSMMIYKSSHIVVTMVLTLVSRLGCSHQIVGYTSGTPDPTTIIPTPTSAILSLGARIIVDDVMKASNSSDSETIAFVEGTCTVLNEPTPEELGQGIFQKVFCDIIYDFGASCENTYECEDIIGVAETLVFNNDPDTNGVGVITGGSGKYAGVSGEIITRDPGTCGSPSTKI